MQRRDCVRGGERFCTRRTGGICWTRGASPSGPGIAADADAIEISGALYCESGSGAFETRQHDMSGAAATWLPLPSPFIGSQQDSVSGVAQLVKSDQSNAQADAGTGAHPARLNATTKISVRRIEVQSTTQA